MSDTDPAWVLEAERDLPRLLADHAHCELKAAQSALSLLSRFAVESPSLVEPLSALAREETEHFREVHLRMAERGISAVAPEVDPYVRALVVAARKNNQDGYPVLLNRLLVCALIEGRSCERFRLLAEGLEDAALRGFYRELMESEARHFTLFLELAGALHGRDCARERFMTLAEREAEIVRALPQEARVHG
jgi:tRNA-(ms[2]io[6]A)-hydroxylase